MDVTSVEAFSGALKQIQSFNFAKTLVLIGSSCDGEKEKILSCSQLGEGRDLSEEAIIINSYLPAGVNVCGLFLPQSSGTPLSSYVTEMISGEIAKKLFPSGRVVLLFTNEEEEKLEEKAVLYELESGQRTSCDLRVVSDCTSWEQSVLIFRIRSELSMKCSYKNKSELPNVFLLQYNFLKNQLQSPSALYHIQQTSILIGGLPNSSSSSSSSNVMGPLSPSNRIQDVLQHLQDDEEDDGFGVAGGKKKKKKTKLDGQVLDVKILFKTGSAQTKEEDAHIPVVFYNDYPAEMHHLAMNLPLDVVVMAPASSPLSHLSSLFIEGVCRQLRAMEICIARHFEKHDICKPEAHHFKPMGLHHLLTVVYPSGVSDQDLESTRQSLHQQFILPQDRPLLRRLNSYLFPEEKMKHVYLMNTHIGLLPSGVSGGKQSLVQGNYTYHHYMQDRFNDDQWGCAYRSLQTLCSWFKLQGYVDCSIPSHKEIQQALVDVGDKQAKFVGSRQWIGSIEVSTVLNQLLGITSKIMFVPNGEEMAMKGRELAAHFQTQGTPVMIGGGVLAHTILGVDFSEKTGDLKFLILDPHYTGGEDIKTIQDKGWCGWKSIDFWDKTEFYNLCLPQRPIEL
ncbi:ufm1-specific protease 2-like [Lytechinus variegatus]|uniref:ufm1-specific protease 2-like n=1 Tax=Lytechinus variegatus TaxID=7654 RepID=UPI001BB2558D|nr:ufm1-specific protease 2-like [Lytechinus variegatus]